MLTVEIKINDRLIEQVSAVNMTADFDSLSSEVDEYLVNGTYIIHHKWADGHRALARQMLKIIKNFKS